MIVKIPVWKKLPATSAINRVWEATLSGSLLRTVILHWMLNRFDRQSFERSVRSKDIAKDFVAEAAIMMMNRFPVVNNADNQSALRALVGNV